MKYAIIASLAFDTPAKRDTMSQTLKDKLVDKFTGAMLKPVWGSMELSEGISMEGKPSNSLVVRFDKPEDMDEVYDLIKDRMVKLPVLKGRVSKHHCPHDEGNKPCVTWEEYVKE